MRYDEALRALYSLEKRGVRLHLERIAEAARLRGDPHATLPVVHIAGTNGKGSTAALVESVARAAGLRTGLFTSPHLHRFVERIRVAGKPLGEAELTRRVRELLSFQAKHPEFPELSFYETATLLAFEVFRDKRCELVVLEVGLGGRLDATNIVQSPLVTAITTIAMDHAHILGPTLGRIAKEKAGILKPGRPLVCSAWEPSPRRVIARRAARVGADASFIGDGFDVTSTDRGCDVRVGDEHMPGLQPGLLGRHQHNNVAAAVAIAVRLREAGFDVPEAAIRRGVTKARWPGRLERIGDGPSFLLDAAHNPEGCRALAAFLREAPPRRRALLFGAMADKQIEAMLEELAPCVDRVVFCPIPINRSARPDALRERSQLSESRTARTVREGLFKARRAAGADGEVVVAGSLFLLGTARAMLLECATEPPIRG